MLIDVEENLEDMLGEDVENLQGYMYILDAQGAMLTHWLYDSEQYHRYSASKKGEDLTEMCFASVLLRSKTVCVHC